MPSLAAQIVGRRVAGVLREHGDAFREELGLRDEGQQRSAAFVFLVAKALLDLSDEEALEGIVDGPAISAWTGCASRCRRTSRSKCG